MDPNTNQPYQQNPQPQPPTQPYYPPPASSQPAEPTPPPTEEPKGPRKLKWTYLLIVLLAIVVLSLLGFIYLNQNNNPTPAPTPTPEAQATATPTPEATTSAPFSTFENLSAEVQKLVSANDVVGLVNQQITTEIECDPNAEYIFTVCEDATETESRDGYNLGRVESEGSILSKAEYIKQLQDIFSSSSPYTFVDEKQNGNKAVIVFKGQPTEGTDSMLGIQAENGFGGWDVVGVIYGPLLQPYKDLDTSIFYF